MEPLSTSACALVDRRSVGVDRRGVRVPVPLGGEIGAGMAELEPRVHAGNRDRKLRPDHVPDAVRAGEGTVAGGHDSCAPDDILTDASMPGHDRRHHHIMLILTGGLSGLRQAA
jgi:hypothetical protein